MWAVAFVIIDADANVFGGLSRCCWGLFPCCGGQDGKEEEEDEDGKEEEEDKDGKEEE